MKKYRIEPACGMRLEAKKGQHVTVIDTEGGQVADFFAEIAGTHDEYLSPSATLDCSGSLHIGVGATLYSNRYRPMFQVVYDDVQQHDLLFPACSKAMYDFFYQNGANHPNCLDNINQALGTGRSMIHPVNLFMNTRVEPSGKITIEAPLSQPGDRIVLKVLEDCVLAVSACSVSESATNSGKCTAIELCLHETEGGGAGVSLRPCRFGDLPELRALSIRTFRETFAALNTPENLQEYLDSAFAEEKLRRGLANETSLFFLLYSENTPAGYLKLNEAPSQTDLNDPDSLEIERIYVRGEFQGKGLGRYLMEQALLTAAERKKKYVWLGVWEKNEKAIGFYQKNGFYKTGTHAFAVGKEVQTDFIMRKDI